MKTTTLLFLIVLFSACNQSGNPVQVKSPAPVLAEDTLRITKKFSGIYFNDGTGKFISCEQPEMTYLLDSDNKLDSARKQILPHAYPAEGIFVQMLAEINSSSDGNYAGLLKVKELVKAKQKNSKNTCIPYDFWCTGTEPFWQLQISKAENLIDFYNPMEEKTTHFSYSAPRTEGNATYYTASDKDQNISITIKNEKCNGATDSQYDYSAEVKLNGKKYNGCAVVFQQ